MHLTSNFRPDREQSMIYSGQLRKFQMLLCARGKSSQELVVEVFTLAPSYSRTLSPFPDMPMRSRMTEAP